jgi:dihydroorotase-like cyclic amidohydrolase
MTGRLIREARLVDGETLDIRTEDGRIAELGPGLSAPAGVPELDAQGLLALPGGVDPHVHFNEPGPRTAWEGWATGSTAAAPAA